MLVFNCQCDPFALAFQMLRLKVCAVPTTRCVCLLIFIYLFRFFELATCYIDQAGLRRLLPPDIASQILGLQVCMPTPTIDFDELI